MSTPPNPFDLKRYEADLVSNNVTAKKSRGHENSLAAHEDNKPRRLKQALRVLVFLRDSGPHTCDEIAGILEIPYTSVSALLSSLKGIGGVVDPPQVYETGEKRVTRYRSAADVIAISAEGEAILWEENL